MKKGITVLVSGPSGVGKGTICTELKKDPELNLDVTISCTTRDPRDNNGVFETDGVEYYFITNEEFEKRIENDYFAEYFHTSNDKYYGTPRNEIDKLVNQGKNVIFEIEINGGKQLVDKELVDCSIFIVAPIETIEQRIRGRGELPEDDVQARLKQAKYELEHHDFYQYEVENTTTIEECVAKCKQLILDTIANNQD